MNDQISADLHRLIGRVWMAAYEAGKREALEPKDPDTMRREALAAALAQDGADARVVGDWTAGEPISAGDRIIDTQGREQVAVEITPINRADVRLKVGDVVTRRDGEELTVASIDGYGSYPVSLNDGVGYMPNGYCYADSRENPSWRDIVTVNSRPIIEN